MNSGAGVGVAMVKEDYPSHKYYWGGCKKGPAEGRGQGGLGLGKQARAGVDIRVRPEQDSGQNLLKRFKVGGNGEQHWRGSWYAEHNHNYGKGPWGGRQCKPRERLSFWRSREGHIGDSMWSSVSWRGQVGNTAGTLGESEKWSGEEGWLSYWAVLGNINRKGLHKAKDGDEGGLYNAL